MIAISLQSGSNGNCTYVEADGVKLLFDAGITGSQARDRLSAFGRDIREVDALIISHDHSDHVRYAGVYQRKYGLPVYITPRTLDRSAGKYDLGIMHNINYFKAGEEINFGHLSVQTVPTPHDAADSSVFVVSSGNKRLGIMTDLGHAFSELAAIIPTLDGIFIESNYDPVMLANGPYPLFLRHRISGPEGHLSNRDAAELLLSGRRLKWACLAHLSNNNNHPEAALRTHREIIGEQLCLYTANRFAPTGVLSL